jgi:hypothetical protein
MRVFKIDSLPVTVSPYWFISDAINSLTTVQFIVEDLQNLTEINIGDEIEITEDATVLFKGTVDTVDESEQSPGRLQYSITGTDFNTLADKRLIANSFVNTTAGDMVRAFITDVLTEEGITAGNIVNGPTIKKAVFNYDKATNALDYIKDVTGLNWNIDFDKKLNLFERSTNISPWSLTDSIQHANFRRTRTRDQYRNKQYIRAGKGETSEQTQETPTPKPDGVSRTFIVRFPLAKKPRLFIKLGAGTLTEVNPADIGVNGIDKNKKFYFSFGSNIISQDETETELVEGDDIKATYKGLYPILTVADDPSQINARKEKETGTSGVYETLTKESSIDESSAALDLAQGLLVKYGVIPSVVEFETEIHGLKAGQLLPIQKDLYNINDSYLIESVNISTNGRSTVYNVKCLDGSSLGGWQEFFKEIIKNGRDYVIQGNEVLILLNLQTEVEGYTGSVKIETFKPHTISNDLIISNNLIISPKTGEVTKLD